MRPGHHPKDTKHGQALNQVKKDEQKDEAWRQGYLLQEALADPRSRPTMAPHMALLDAFLLDEQKRRTRLADEKAEILREFLHAPIRAQACARYKVENITGPYHSAWRWGLLRYVVNSQKNIEQGNGKGLAMFLTQLVKKAVTRPKIRKGPQPPMPEPIPPPSFVQAFDDLVAYEKKVKEYLRTRWEDGLPIPAQVGSLERRTLSFNTSAPLEHIPIEDRELLTARTKHNREKVFSNFVRAKSANTLSASCSPLQRRPAKSRTDSKHHKILEVDYSFAEMETLERMLHVEPKGLVSKSAKAKDSQSQRDSTSSSQDLPPSLSDLSPQEGELRIITCQTKNVTYAYKHDGTTRLELRKLLDSQKTPPVKTYAGQRLNLSNNKLTNVDKLPQILPKKAVCADTMVWINLSHNRLVEVPQCMEHFKCLTTLHFHSNKIASVHGLRHLPLLAGTLTDFTFHGNSLEKKCDAHARHVALVVLPKLKMLNFGCVLDTEREKAFFVLRSQFAHEFPMNVYQRVRPESR